MIFNVTKTDALSMGGSVNLREYGNGSSRAGSEIYSTSYANEKIESALETLARDFRSTVQLGSHSGIDLISTPIIHLKADSARKEYSLTDHELSYFVGALYKNMAD